MSHLRTFPRTGRDLDALPSFLLFFVSSSFPPHFILDPICPLLPRFAARPAPAAQFTKSKLPALNLCQNRLINLRRSTLQAFRPTTRPCFSRLSEGHLVAAVTDAQPALHTWSSGPSSCPSPPSPAEPGPLPRLLSPLLEEQSALPAWEVGEPKAWDPDPSPVPVPCAGLCPMRQGRCQPPFYYTRSQPMAWYAVGAKYTLFSMEK